MRIDDLNRRVSELENQMVLPVKIRIGWYDDPEPLDPNVNHIQLRWYDEIVL